MDKFMYNNIRVNVKQFNEIWKFFYTKCKVINAPQEFEWPICIDKTKIYYRVEFIIPIKINDRNFESREIIAKIHSRYNWIYVDIDMLINIFCTDWNTLSGEIKNLRNSNISSRQDYKVANFFYNGNSISYDMYITIKDKIGKFDARGISMNVTRFLDTDITKYRGVIYKHNKEIDYRSMIAHINAWTVDGVNCFNTHPGKLISELHMNDYQKEMLRGLVEKYNNMLEIKQITELLPATHINKIVTESH